MGLTVVTGTSGHVGGNLVRELIKRGRKVRCLVREDKRALDGLDVELFQGDVLDVEGLKKAFEGADVVHHLAARISICPGDEKQVHDVNVNGVRNVVNACLETGVRRLVHFSSVHAYSQDPFDETIDESRPLALSDDCLPYDRGKAGGEIEALEGVKKGLDAVIVSPAAVIGVHDYKPSRMGEVLLMIYHKKMPALIDAGFDWVDVRDIVEGAIAAEEKGKTGRKYILSGYRLSLKDMADLVSEISGVKPPAFVSPMWLARVGAPFATAWAKMTGSTPLYTSQSLRILRGNSDFSNARAAEELGYKPRPIEESVKDFLSWYEKSRAHLGF